MTTPSCATVGEVERVRATRVEVARLVSLLYRERLNAWQEWMVLQLIRWHLRTLPLADRESEVRPHYKDVDWSFTEQPAVKEAIGAAVNRVMRQYQEKLSATEDDLTQSARIIVVEHKSHAKRALARGYLHRWIWQRLVRMIRAERRDTSLDAIFDRESEVASNSSDDPWIWRKVDPVWKGKPYRRKPWR